MKITYKQLIDAVEQNGFVQARGILARRDNENKIISACAMGQALINLGIRDLFGGERLINKIITLNDSVGMTPKEIAAIVRKDYASHLHREIQGKEYDWNPEIAPEARLVDNVT